ncbi:MAG: HXXEE domain-containing protein [Prevotellamassilia sp.]|nr:HXXEE domain-containing protein [Prevotellamassilia sp.]
MSPLSVLILVLPLPLAFLLHDAEEVAVQHRWMENHSGALRERFLRLRPLLDRLQRLNTKAFALAALEEFIVLLCATACVLADVSFALELWAALFLAFSLHLLLHFGQAVAVRGYVPGLVTSILLSPFAAYGIFCISLVMSPLKMFALAVAGASFVALNLLFAHWLGLKLTSRR